MQNTTNVFLKGMTTDMHPLTQDQQSLSHAMNATLITFNGNEQMLQNDMGNARIQDKKTGNIMGLREGFIPVGIKEHGGIIYIASVNKDGVGEIGTIPSPVITFSNPKSISEDLTIDLNQIITDLKVSKTEDESPLYKLTSETVSAGEKFIICIPLDGNTEISTIDKKRKYKINLHSQTQTELIKLNPTNIYYKQVGFEDKLSDYWFIDCDSDDLDLDKMTAEDDISGNHIKYFQRYPNIPNGHLMISIEKENIDYFEISESFRNGDYWNMPASATEADKGIVRFDNKIFKWKTSSKVNVDNIVWTISDEFNNQFGSINELKLDKEEFNRWYTINAVYYSKDWVKPLGTYTYSFNPHLQFEMKSNLSNIRLENHQYGKSKIEQFTQKKDILNPDTQIIEIKQANSFDIINEDSSRFDFLSINRKVAGSPSDRDLIKPAIIDGNKQSVSFESCFKSLKEYNVEPKTFTSTYLNLEKIKDNYYYSTPNNTELNLKLNFKFSSEEGNWDASRSNYKAEIKVIFRITHSLIGTLIDKEEGVIDWTSNNKFLSMQKDVFDYYLKNGNLDSKYFQFSPIDEENADKTNAKYYLISINKIPIAENLTFKIPLSEHEFDKLTEDPILNIEILSVETKQIRASFEEYGEKIPLYFDISLESSINGIEQYYTETISNISNKIISPQQDWVADKYNGNEYETVKINYKNGIPIECNINSDINYCKMSVLDSSDILTTSTSIDARQFYKKYSTSEKLIKIAENLKKRKGLKYILLFDVGSNFICSIDSNSFIRKNPINGIINYKIFEEASSVKINCKEINRIGIYTIDELVTEPILQSVIGYKEYATDSFEDSLTEYKYEYQFNPIEPYQEEYKQN